MLAYYFSDFMPHEESFGIHTTILFWYEIAVWLACIAWVINCVVGWKTVQHMPPVVYGWIEPLVKVLGVFGIVSIIRSALNGIVLHYPFYGLQALVFFVDAHLVIGIATLSVWYIMRPEASLFTRLAQHKRNSDRFQAMAESSRIMGIIEIDEESNIWFANSAAHRIFGYEPGELLGQDIKILMPERFHRDHEIGLEYFLRTGESELMKSPHPVGLQGLRKNVVEFPLELSLSAYSLSDAYRFVAIIRDISYRVSLENENDYRSD